MAVAWASGEAITIVADDAADAGFTSARPPGWHAGDGRPAGRGMAPAGPLAGASACCASPERAAATPGSAPSSANLPLSTEDGLPPAACARRPTARRAACTRTPPPLPGRTRHLAAVERHRPGLSIVSATAENGTVSIASSTTLLYRQPAAFAGTDHATYTIQDPLAVAARRSSLSPSRRCTARPHGRFHPPPSGRPCRDRRPANDSGVDMTVTAVGDPRTAGSRSPAVERRSPIPPIRCFTERRRLSPTR